jgi:hypothetical protein
VKFRGTKRFLLEVEGFGPEGYVVRLFDEETQEAVLADEEGDDLYDAITNLGDAMVKNDATLGVA